MKRKLLEWYRHLPWFKGKLRIGKLFFKGEISKSQPEQFTAHYGVRYKIPNTLENIGVELFINGVYEIDIIQFLASHIRDGCTFFDIGANIGSISLPLLKLKKDLHYHGFEAAPMVFEFLQENFKANIVGNYALQNKLVHRNDQETLRFYQAELYGKSSLAPTYTSEFVEVQSISLDQYCSDMQIKQIDWIKVDVQGFELYVFEGMAGLLREKRIGNILFEFESWAEDQAQIERGAAQRYLQNAGYALYGIDGLPLEISSKHGETMIWAKPNS